MAIVGEHLNARKNFMFILIFWIIVTFLFDFSLLKTRYEFILKYWNFFRILNLKNFGYFYSKSSELNFLASSFGI